MPERAVRVGFVGCGKQSSDAWYPNFTTIPELKLQACCDIQADRAERNAQVFGARNYYTDLETMLEKEDLGAVIVVGPPDMHYTCGKKVLEAGLPLIMEKPVATRTEEALELVQLAESKRLVTQVGHNMRHAPGVSKFRELMRGEDFGKLLYLESRYFMPDPMWHETASYRRGWNYMIYQAVHAIDLARYMAGEIRAIHAQLAVGAEGRFAVSCLVEFSGDATGSINLTGGSPNWSCQLEAAGDGHARLSLTNLHTLEYEHATTESGYRPTPGIPAQIWTPAVRDNAEVRGGYWHQMQSFARTLLYGFPTSPNLRDAYKAMLVCEAILQSIDQRAPVRLDEESNSSAS
jgi:predicted dehydrogenase